MERETELTRKRYNRIALFYDSMDRMITPEMRQKVMAQASGKVLEVGVGTGKNLAFYSTSCTDVTGIDISPGMLSRAKNKLKEAKVPVNLLEMDAEHMSFADDTYDTVVVTCVFCSVPDPVKGLQEIHRVCKPGGKVILLEHVRSDKPLIGKIMDILDPIVVRMMGAHINRRTVENVTMASLQISSIENQKISILKLINARP